MQGVPDLKQIVWMYGNPACCAFVQCPLEGLAERLVPQSYVMASAG